MEIEKRLSNAGYRMLSDKQIEDLILDILKKKNIRFLKAIPFLIHKNSINLDIIPKKGILNKGIIAITSKIFTEFNIQPQQYSKEDISKSNLNYSEFKEEFELQHRNEKKGNLLIEKQKIYEERDLQMHISTLFTKKEKEIIQNLIYEKEISKTEYEYYSRKTKKKLNSIVGLYDFAKTLQLKNPKFRKI